MAWSCSAWNPGGELKIPQIPHIKCSCSHREVDERGDKIFVTAQRENATEIAENENPC
jgi:hypothetical protein